MTQTPQEAQADVAGALHDLSDSSRALVRHEITAAQREMWAKGKQSAPAFALLGAAACLGMFSAAASYRLSIRLLERVLPPAAAAATAAAGYGLAAVAAGAIGTQRLRKAAPLLPVETARETAGTVAETAESAARTARAARR